MSPLTRTSIGMPALAVLLLAGCVDDHAGALLYSGQPAIQVGLDRVAITPTASIRGRLGSATAPDSLNVEIRGLPTLAGSAQYQLWVVDAATGTATRIPFTHVALQADTVGIDPFTEEPIIEWNPVGEAAQKEGFAGAPGQRHSVIVHEDALPIDLATGTHLVLTAGEGSANPADAAAPLWYRYQDDEGSFDARGSASFGFNPTQAAADRAWTAEGTGRVEFLNTVGFGIVTTRAIRPPRGYFYGTWLLHEDTGEALWLGDLATPAPEYASLRNADVEQNEFMSPTRILNAGFWAEWAELGRVYSDFTHVALTLEPKAADQSSMSPIVIYRAAIPADLDKLPNEKEGIDQLF